MPKLLHEPKKVSTFAAMESNGYHIPVLLGPSVGALNVRRGGVYVDVTLGGGGHTRRILEALEGTGHLYSMDQDSDALEHFGADGLTNHTLVWSNFRHLRRWMRYYGVEGIDGLLADLGVSSHHFDDESRGFSLRMDAPLDMRMNRRAASTAADVVNTYTEEHLTSVLRLYGELRQARAMATALVRARARQPIQTTSQLVQVLTPLTAPQHSKKELAQAFQALRIEVNHEMDALAQMLGAATTLLRPGGRLVVLSYHSLEDRIVKNMIRSGNIEGQVQTDIYGRGSSPLVAVGRPLTANNDEVEANPRSRSAVMRVAEKR